MISYDVLQKETNLLTELIEGCIEAEGYKIEKIINKHYKIKNKEGKEFSLYFSVKS